MAADLVDQPGEVIAGFARVALVEVETCLIFGRRLSSAALGDWSNVFGPTAPIDWRQVERFATGR